MPAVGRRHTLAATEVALRATVGTEAAPSNDIAHKSFPRRVPLPKGLPAGGGIQKSKSCLVMFFRNPRKASVWIPAFAGMTYAQQPSGPLASDGAK